METKKASLNSLEKLLIMDEEGAQLATTQKTNFYRVISISSPRNSDISFRKRPTRLPNAQEALYLEFDDVIPKYVKLSGLKNLYLPTTQQCEQALSFLNKGGQRIVHCRAGVSRSTGIAFGYLLEHYNNYEEAINYLFSIRAIADPNSYVVFLMLQILGRESLYEEILIYIRQKQKNCTRKYL